MTTNPVRQALARMDWNDRHALLDAARARVNDDPNNTGPLTEFWFAIYCEITYCEAGEVELRHQARRDARTAFDPAAAPQIAELEELFKL